jgi:hypothetical protein
MRMTSDALSALLRFSIYGTDLAIAGNPRDGALRCLLAQPMWRPAALRHKRPIEPCRCSAMVTVRWISTSNTTRPARIRKRIGCRLPTKVSTSDANVLAEGLQPIDHRRKLEAARGVRSSLAK